MYKRFLVLKSAIYSFWHIQIQQIWSASALYVWKTHELSAGCAVSHARPSAASFLKVQLLIRSVLLLIVQGPGWPCLPETISGFCFLFFWKSGWSCNMIRISWSLRTMSHRSRQTGIAKGISLPPLHAQSLCFYKDFFLSSLCFLMHTLTNTWGVFLLSFASYPLTSPHLLPVLAISQPSCCSADVTEEPSEHLSQRLWCWIRVTERQGEMRQTNSK